MTKAIQRCDPFASVLIVKFETNDRRARFSEYGFGIHKTYSLKRARRSAVLLNCTIAESSLTLASSRKFLVKHCLAAEQGRFSPFVAEEFDKLIPMLF